MWKYFNDSFTDNTIFVNLLMININCDNTLNYFQSNAQIALEIYANICIGCCLRINY